MVYIEKVYIENGSLQLNSKLDRVLFVQSVMATLPLAIAVIPWGILAGAMAVQAGFTPIQSQILSLLVFAGAAQLSALSLFATGASYAAIFGSTLVISSRHLLYSVTFRERVLILPGYWRVLIAFVLTDEMFAVSEAHTLRSGKFSAFYALVSGFTFYVIWNLATLVGIIAGDSFGNLDDLGLDFAIVATFIAMTFAQLRSKPILVAMLVSGSLAIILKPFLSDSYLIVAAIVGMLTAYFSESDISELTLNEPDLRMTKGQTLSEES